MQLGLGKRTMHSHCLSHSLWRVSCTIHRYSVSRSAQQGLYLSRPAAWWMHPAGSRSQATQATPAAAAAATAATSAFAATLAAASDAAVAANSPSAAATITLAAA